MFSMRHGVDSSHRTCKFGLSLAAYSQKREIRSPGRLPSGRRETGAEIRDLPENTGDLASLVGARHTSRYELLYNVRPDRQSMGRVLYTVCIPGVFSHAACRWARSTAT